MFRPLCRFDPVDGSCEDRPACRKGKPRRTTEAPPRTRGAGWRSRAGDAILRGCADEC
ncbi:hypothetical protein [Azospirillum doebereinerae]